MVGQPLLWLLTLPLHLFPAAWVPLGLNVFSAALAALTLALLARTVQLLPWDQPLENLPRRVGTLPVLLACTLCGMEFSFWQEATAATGEMLDLFLLAAALWLLLEYRVRRESRWLNAATLVWGLGMADNWLMLLALPLFIGGVIWLQGFRFFKVKSCLRLAGLGLVGFSIYALLPLVNGLASHSPWSLGQAWLVSLKQTKGQIAQVYRLWVAHRLFAVAVALYFLVPTLSLLVRLRDEGNKNKSQVDRFQNWLYRSLRAVLLLACLWLAFDPTAGLRQIIQHQFGDSLRLLTFDYLNALGAAFLAGNLLLISLGHVDQRRRSRVGRLWQQLAVPTAATGLVLISIALVARNAPAILRLNLYPLQCFGELAVASLPVGRGVMLSEQPAKLQVFQAALAQHRNRVDWLAVDTHALPTVAYRAELERQRPLGWLTDETRHELTRAEMLRLLVQIARTNRLCYLHYGYGDFFERFYLEPTGAIYEMKLWERNSPEHPPLPAAVTEATETFWTAAWQRELAALVPAPTGRPTGWRKKIERLGFTPAPLSQDRLLAGWYSLALNSWGVELQQQGRWPAARIRFEQALQLNATNVPAQVNLSGNTNFQSGHKLGLDGMDQLAAQVGIFQYLSLHMENYGPFDAPIYCYVLGHAFEQNGCPLQAAQQFERAQTLAPDTVAPKFALARLYTRLRWNDRALPLIHQLREATDNLSPNLARETELALLEATSWLAQTNPANAQVAFQSILRRHPGDVALESRVIITYLEYGEFTNALRLVEAQLSRSPHDVPTLNQQAFILIQTGHAAAAIPVLDHVLALTNLPSARLSHARAQMACQDFSAAESDYRELEKSGAYPREVSYGLAAMAERRHDTNQMVHYLRAGLAHTPPETPQWRQVNARLQAVERGLPFPIPRTGNTD